MITKEQIEKEAAAYTNENNGSGFEFQAFVTGAEWAAEHYEAEQKDAAQLMASAATEIINLRAALLESKEIAEKVTAWLMDEMEKNKTK